MKTIMVVGGLFFLCTICNAEEHQFIKRMEKKYNLPEGSLMYIGQTESLHGLLMGETLVKDVISEKYFPYLEKIAKHTNRKLHKFKGSSYGAMGYMQIISPTFWRYKQDGDGDGIRDPLNHYDNIATAGYYLSRLIAKHGKWKAFYVYSGRSESYANEAITFLKVAKKE